MMNSRACFQFVILQFFYLKCCISLVVVAVVNAFHVKLTAVDIISEGKGIVDTVFCYTTDKADKKFRFRKWQSIPAKRSGKTLSVKLPEGIYQGFFSAYDEKTKRNDCCGSSNVLFFGDGE